MSPNNTQTVKGFHIESICEVFICLQCINGIPLDLSSASEVKDIEVDESTCLICQKDISDGDTNYFTEQNFDYYKKLYTLLNNLFNNNDLEISMKDSQQQVDYSYVRVSVKNQKTEIINSIEEMIDFISDKGIVRGKRIDSSIDGKTVFRFFAL